MSQTKQEKLDDLVKDTNITNDMVVQVATMDGALGLFVLTSVPALGGIDARFVPLTEDLSKQLKCEELYRKSTAAQRAAAKKMVEEGKVFSWSYLQKHCDFDLDTKLGKRLADAVAYIAQKEPYSVAMALADPVYGENFKIRIVDDMPAKVLGAASKRGVRINGRELLDADSVEVIANLFHEMGGHRSERVPEHGLNARQSGLAHGVITEARAQTYEDLVLLGAKRTELLTDGPVDLKLLKEFYNGSFAEKGGVSLDRLVELKKSNRNLYSIFVYKMSAEKLEDIFLDKLKKQASNMDYTEQMLRHGVLNTLENPSGDLRVLRAYVDDICDNFSLGVSLDKNKVWEVVEAQATGKVPVPALDRLFTKEGKLALPSAYMERLRDLRVSDLELQNLGHPEVICSIAAKNDPNWKNNTPKEFFKFLEDEGYKFFPPELEEIHQKVERASFSFSTTEEEMSKLLDKQRECLKKYGLKYDDVDFDTGLIRTEKVKSRFESWGEMKAKAAGMGDSASSIRPHASSHPIRNTVISVGGRVVAMYAAGWAGQQFQDWEKARERNGLGPVMGISDNTTYALKKADEFVAGAGLVVMGGGMVMAIPRVAARVTATQSGQRIATTIPLVGTALGLYYAGRRAVDGDWTGVGLELASAGMDIVSAAGILTGPGETGIMGASIALDAFIAARDGFQKNGECAFAMVDEAGNSVMLKDENGEDVPVLGARINYKHDVRQGEALFYDIGENGSYLALRGEYKNDKRTGEWVRRGPNKEELEVAHYKDGVLVGKYSRADKKGQPLVVANFTAGKYVSFWPDENGLSTGKPRCVGEIKGGHCVGIWSMYDKDGMLSKEVDYETNVVREYKWSQNKNGEWTATTKEKPFYIPDFQGTYEVKYPGRLNPSHEAIGANSVHNPVPDQVIIPGKQNPETIDDRFGTIPTVDVPKPAPTRPMEQPKPPKQEPTKPVEQSKPSKQGPTRPVEQPKPPKQEPTKPVEQPKPPKAETPLLDDRVIDLNDPVQRPDRTSTTTVITPDGKVWEIKDGNPVEVGKASTIDGVHIMYNGDNMPQNPIEATNVVVLTNTGETKPVPSWTAGNEAGTFASEVTNRPVPTYISPSKPSSSGYELPLEPVTNPSKPAPTAVPTQNPKPEPAPAPKLEPQKPAEQPKPPKQEPQKPVEQPKPPKQEPTKPSEPAPAPKPEPQKPAPTKPAEQQRPPRERHESGGKKPTSDKPSPVAQADPRKQRHNQNSKSSKPKSAPAPTTQPAKPVENSTPTSQPAKPAEVSTPAPTKPVEQQRPPRERHESGEKKDTASVVKDAAKEVLKTTTIGQAIGVGRQIFNAVQKGAKVLKEKQRQFGNGKGLDDKLSSSERQFGNGKGLDDKLSSKQQENTKTLDMPSKQHE